MLHSQVTLWHIFVWGRSAVTGAFLLLLVLMNAAAPTPAPRPLYVFALVQFSTNIFYLYLWRRRAIRALGILSLNLDIVFISLLILMLGADGYVFLLAYLWPIIMGGWLIGRRAILPLTFLGIAGYGVLVSVARQDWAPRRLLLPTGIPQSLVLCLPYLAFISLLVWLLTREMERGERHLQARNRDLHRVNFGLRYLVAAGEELLGCPAADVVALALRKVAKLTGHSRGAIYLRDDEGLVLRAASGWPPCSVSPSGGSTCDGSAHDGTSPYVPAIPADWLTAGGEQRLGAIHTVPLSPDEAAHSAAPDQPPPSSLTYVALRSTQGLEGVLEIASTQPRPFDAGEEQLLQLFGHQLGVALENARLLANLQRERNLLGSILAQMADGVLVVGAEGRVLLANAAAHALLGVQQGEPLPSWLERQMADGASEDGIGRHVVEVDDRVVGLSVAELAAGAGVPRATIYVARDVTQEAQLERAKSDFVAYVSHELRTPLTTIKMLVRLLLMDATEGSKQREYLSIIDSQVTRQTRLVNNLLDFTRLEAGKYDLPIEEVDLRAVIRSSVSVCRPLAEERGLHLQVACPTQMPLLLANAGGLEQVLVNLLSNAIKFTDEGGRVTVTCHPQPDAVYLSVEDTGIGMSPEQTERIFEKFYSVRHSRKRGEGTGLGLVISRMIMHELGGDIEAVSHEGTGSRFTVRLPRKQAAPAPRESAAEGVRIGAAQPLGG